ncbi:MAG: ATP-dependent DNA ligase [Methyloceanibacter sp.]|uniref:ATP-dependent DNA ligase n=1 Tax=Methyloceanibacter sp. TaxID=1965321 RepID=UPI003EE06CC9
MAAPKSLAELAVPTDLEPMEAKLVSELPEDNGWQFEPKWDGFRCLAFRAGDQVELRAKSGKPLTRYFPELVEALKALKPKCFVLDGELAIPVGTRLSFDALQQRIHPAESRVDKLAAETPSILILFDMLVDAKNKSLIAEPLTKRRRALEAFNKSVGGSGSVKLSPATLDRNEAERWLGRASGSLDGVVAKRLDGPYLPGERAMLKVKLLRTADCVVGGFRYAANSTEVGSLLLGLYNDEGKLDHVGFTSTITNVERPALTKLLEGLITPPGFTGKAPSGPSRWSTDRSSEWKPVKPKIVVEVRYDQVTGERFRHGTKLVRFRPDKAPTQCTFEQILPARKPPKLIATMLGQ